MAKLTRRDMLGLAGGLAAGAAVAGARERHRNEEIPHFRFAMEKQKGRVTRGGSAREATVKQLPISRGIAGVSMRLKPGGLRELHWHANAAEWAFVVKGRVRTTVLAPDGTSETNDFEPGDVWYFPRGHGHALQGLGPEDAHFVLVFDNGSFSEYGTFSSTDWLGHIPPQILAKSLGLPRSAFDKFPKEEQYIIQGRVPPEKPQADRRRGLKSPPQTHRFPLLAQKPKATYPGGEERIVSAREFPISKTITGVILDLKPGAVREPHWHPHANEWQYYISGRARMTIFGSHGRARTEEFSPGDAGYVPQGFGHYIETVGNDPCRILSAFDSGDYQEIGLSTWLAANPVRLVADNFQLADAVVDKLPDHQVFIASKEGPGR
jgi:oxalate decarboxylase